MHSHLRLAATSLVGLALLAAPFKSALAQETYYPPPPSGPPPPPSAQAPNGEYVAPLQQGTQPSYVPQSVAMSGPRRITDWDSSEPVPAGYHVATHVRTGLMVGGAVMFGTLYLISVLVAAGSQDATSAEGGSSNPDAALYIPAIGPFLQMGNTSSATGNVFLAIDGIAQCGGIAMFIYGIASPRTYLLRNDLGTSAPRVMVLPTRLGRDGYGLGLTAHF
jgi:hypothetical protein